MLTDVGLGCDERAPRGSVRIGFVGQALNPPAVIGIGPFAVRDKVGGNHAATHVDEMKTRHARRFGKIDNREQIAIRYSVRVGIEGRHRSREQSRMARV